MLNKLKKFYRVEKIFLFILLIIAISNPPMENFRAFLAIVLFVLLINRFEESIRKDYNDTLKDYFVRVMEGEEDNEEDINT